ncbi:MAG TPA: hypothetical protein VMB79_17320 [Jatrophihabitans sp.]|nr:hypothetical protein [Jatrophihabitans sp.]
MGALKSLLRKVFSVRVADISGVGSAAATAPPPGSLHRVHPVGTSLPEAGPDADPEGAADRDDS